MRHLPPRLLIAAISTLRSTQRWVDDVLTDLDSRLCQFAPEGYDLDDEDDEDLGLPTCICGSTEHTSRRVSYVGMTGLLHNGEHEDLDVAVTLDFNETDPYAVTMTLNLQVEVDGKIIGSDDICWAYARDLLDTALSREDETVVGDGDVSMQYMPTWNELWVWLTDIDGVKHRLDLPAGPVKDFMATSFRLVPSGEENHGDVEDEIAHLLDGGQK